MKKNDVDSTEDQEKLLKHIAKFIHDIRTPLFGVAKNTEDAHEILQSLSPASDLITDPESSADIPPSSGKKQLISKLQSIDLYAQSTNEIVNDFWAKTLVLLSDADTARNSQPITQVRHIVKNKPTKEKKQVLLVEDNEFNQQVGLEMLRELGFQVTIANNGFQALELIESQNFQLILMDCRLPELDGWETTIAIRKKQLGATIPIIGLTASLDESDHKHALEAGMNDCLSKPLTLDALERIVDIYVS